MDHEQAPSADSSLSVLKTTEKRIGSGLAGPGRPKGRKSDAVLAAEEFARSIVESDEYRELVWKRLRAGILPPAVEVLLHHYAHGKPTDRVELSGADGEPLEVIACVRRVIVDPQERDTSVVH